MSPRSRRTRCPSPVGPGGRCSADLVELTLLADFFSPQQLLQLYWLSRFFRSNTKNDQEALKYAPYYVVNLSRLVAG